MGPKFNKNAVDGNRIGIPFYGSPGSGKQETLIPCDRYKNADEKAGLEELD